MTDAVPYTVPLRILTSRLDARTLRRMLVAGAAWGMTVSLGLTAMRAWSCGTVCLDAAAFDVLVTAAIGTVTIGPLACLRRSSERVRT
ncbi:hypothetical protein PQJ75_25230 [Rhodoplanes sp. TEM]|uniref:Uncharacterized protein n=1 Tax=Rhodoplanes tepidamans TaxID=200616 RepID=A0ABT5JHS9_RHOTP|nr:MULTISPECIES: hypothetical protein [Rhodoplanes]MDC7789268.1 hypothetical protein [Rhodoplanes tepidamans]MDC7987047.1 hypothetical protein [Rhodoplanes sp. TEM]MDQ0355541.1 hypothetical protein [Rhodoplanes tepidamans]